MFDGIHAGGFEYLNLQPYFDDFSRNFDSGISTQIKLERGQDFNERGFASWEAFASGDWDGALALADERRDAYARLFERGIAQRRLRVVEFPVTPYVQWEMHVLRLRAELGEDIRVLDARLIADIERDSPVPEMVTLGEVVLYQVFYHHGDAAGARRFTDPAVIAEARDDFDTLFEQGEEFFEFFGREVKPLPPPDVTR
jgi:hypothetical protein